MKIIVNAEMIRGRQPHEVCAYISDSFLDGKPFEEVEIALTECAKPLFASIRSMQSFIKILQRQLNAPLENPDEEVLSAT